MSRQYKDNQIVDQKVDIRDLGKAGDMVSCIRG